MRKVSDPELRGVYWQEAVRVRHAVRRRESGRELFAAVMVMNARREPHLLQVGGQFGKEFAFTVALPVGVNGFEHTAYAQVVTAVLVEQDVASLQCCLLQIIDKRFFLERQFSNPSTL